MPITPRLAAAVLAGKTAAVLSRRLRLGGGTTFPGTVARRVDPRALARLARRLRRGSLVVTGTNGKTTTSRMIAHCLEHAGWRPVHNRAGANLPQGVTAALLDATDLCGRTRADVGLFEVDEAAFPLVVAEVRPRAVVLTNLFRDQLDRYGELDYLATLWRNAMARLPRGSVAVLNADDPKVAGLGTLDLSPLPSSPGRGGGDRPGANGVASSPFPTREGGEGVRSLPLFFGVSDPSVGIGELPHAADSKTCPHCGSRYDYGAVFYGHLGLWRCPGCGDARPAPQVNAVRVELLGDAGSRCTVETPRGNLELRLALPGLYNVYNALAATAGALALGVDLHVIGEALAGFTAAFGRVERIPVGDRTLFMALVKNPVGFGEVLRTLFAEPARSAERHALIAINDRLADGTDVSWLWDVDFELLAGRLAHCTVTGTRAEDMAVRLKYANVDPARVQVEPKLEAALDAALAATPPGETLYALPTYTAMLDLRALLADRGHVERFWEN